MAIKVNMNLISITIILIFSVLGNTQNYELIYPGWHVVGASIEPGYYLVQVNTKRNLDDGNIIDTSIAQQPPDPTQNIKACSVIAYSDYWTENRGWSVSNGYGIFKVRHSDYAIQTDCFMVKVQKNFNPQTPFTTPIINAKRIYYDV